jgi:hypothetical protein
MLKRPSPALVVAALALFLALVGSGVAATSGHVAATRHKRKHTTVLTPNAVNQLIASYLRHHHFVGPTGPKGATGGTGGTGATGPQGPGAKQIVASVAGLRTFFSIGTVGPWNISLSCLFATADVNIQGPGSFAATITTGAATSGTTTSPQPATTAVRNGPMGASGFTVNTGNTPSQNQQVATDVELISGNTMEELHLQLTGNPTADNNGNCSVTGSAIPVS